MCRLAGTGTCGDLANFTPKKKAPDNRGLFSLLFTFRFLLPPVSALRERYHLAERLTGAEILWLQLLPKDVLECREDDQRGQRIPPRLEAKASRLR